MKKRTKIIATIGPASEDKETLRKMVGAGMNIARLNFSHGTYENHQMIYENIRAVSRELNVPISIHQDLQGPKIRVGELPKEGIELKENEQVVFSTAIDKFDGKEIPMTYRELHKEVKKGDRVLLDDGLMEVMVEGVSGNSIKTFVIKGGVLGSHKAFNVPGVKLSAPSISEKDEDDLKFGLKLGVDWIWQSFVKSNEDVKQLKALIKKYFDGDIPPKIMAKIEKQAALEDIDEIIKVADGIVIARGDLAVEIDQAKVPRIQKMLIEKCRIAGKPVVVATQMLESMKENPRPTRAELSDVAHAVFDHTDCTTLSAETTTGKYPVESVKTMAEIIKESEISPYDDVLEDLHVPEKALKLLPYNPAFYIFAASAVKLAKTIRARGIVIASSSEEIAHAISAHRYEIPIVLLTPHKRIQNQAVCGWAMDPHVVPEAILKSLEDKNVEKFIEELDAHTLPRGEGGIVFINDFATDIHHHSSLLHVIN